MNLVSYFAPSSILFLFFNANKQISPIRSLHLATSGLVSQNVHWYALNIQWCGPSKIMLFYLRLKARHCSGSVGPLKLFLCLRYDPISANKRSNCPNDILKNVWKSSWYNSWIKALNSLCCWTSHEMNPESQFITFLV